MEYDRLLKIFLDYVNNDLETSYDNEQTRHKLENVATKEEIVMLGFGWLYPEDC